MTANPNSYGKRRSMLHELNQRYKQQWDRAERLQDEQVPGELAIDGQHKLAGIVLQILLDTVELGCTVFGKNDAGEDDHREERREHQQDQITPHGNTRAQSGPDLLHGAISNPLANDRERHPTQHPVRWQLLFVGNLRRACDTASRPSAPPHARPVSVRCRGLLAEPERLL